MRTHSTLWRACFLVLALPVAALAADEGATAKVAALKTIIADADAKWIAKWRAYRAAKDAIDAAKGADKATAQAAYTAIQKDVADAIRRDSLPVSGWLMGFFGASLLWGGLAFCIGVARKSGGGKGG